MSGLECDFFLKEVLILQVSFCRDRVMVLSLKTAFWIGTRTAPDLVKVNICLSVVPDATPVTANTLCEASSLTFLRVKSVLPVGYYTLVTELVLPSLTSLTLEVEGLGLVIIEGAIATGWLDSFLLSEFN